MDQWRAAERRVQRAWEAWLAAPLDETNDAYERLDQALSEEERVASRLAELEQSLDSTCEPPLIPFG